MGKTALKGLAAFDQFYTEVYGEEWRPLKRSLCAQGRYVASWNPYVSYDQRFEQKEKFLNRNGCFLVEKVPAPEMMIEGLKNYYLFDPASLMPVLNLQLEQEHIVADFCAAPGGKALHLVYAAPAAEFYFNDRSPTRGQRLKKVCREYLPAHLWEKIHFSQRNAGTWGMEFPQKFDRILLDAPCSSERHLLHSPEHMKDWSPKRSQKLSKEQMTLLCSAYDALKMGGRLVYSTCSISPLENQQLVEKFCHKRPGVRVVKANISLGKNLEYGEILLPHQSGFGPIYFCVIEKSKNQ